MFLPSSRSSSFSSTEITALQNWTEEEKRNLCLTVWVDSNQMQVAVCPIKGSKKTIYLQPTNSKKSADVFNSFRMLSTSFAAHQCQVVFATMSRITW